MKKIAIGLALLLLPMLVSAHEVKSVGTLDILLHMEPLDNPAVNENAFLYFSVADSQNLFDFKNCECTVIVKDSAGKELLKRVLTAEDEAPDWGVNVSRIPFVFPHVGIYKVKIIGQPQTNSFTAFELEYDKRIERIDENASLVKTDAEGEAPWYKSYYAIGGAILIFGIIINEAYSKLKRKNK